MIKKLIVLCSVALMLAGCENEKEKTISETHTIVSIKDGNITGENVNGDNGIYYTVYDFKQHGIDNINVGDKVEITWLEENYSNEDWIIESVDLVE